MSKKSNEAYRIRYYHPTDYPALVNLWMMTGIHTPARDDSDEVIRRTIDTGAALLIMEDESHTLIGSSWITHDARRSWIHHFCIHPQWQGMGLANVLMDKTMDEVDRIGFQVKLEVHHENAEAIALYQKYGFRLLDGYLVYMVR